MLGTTQLRDELRDPALAKAILNAAFRQLAVGTSSISQRYTPSQLTEVIARTESGEGLGTAEGDPSNAQIDHIDHVSPRSPWHAVTPARFVTTSIVVLASHQVATHLELVNTFEATANMLSGPQHTVRPRD